MISYIRGELIDRTDSTVVLDVNGIGYEIWVPYGTLCSVSQRGGIVELYTYLQVKEDQIALFGFKTKSDLRAFKLLITVNGIGPKGALSIMSSMSTEDLMLAVISEDVKTIAKTPGIGAKTAGKMVLELKDKFSLSDTLDDNIGISKAGSGAAKTEEESQVRNETVQALTALGYSASEALKAVRGIEITADMTPEMLLKLSLKNMK